MTDGIYFYREAPGTQQHVVELRTPDAGPQVCFDLSGKMSRIRGPRYVSDMKGMWNRVDRAVAAATYLMAVLGGSSHAGEGRWTRKSIRNLYEHCKKEWPEFAPGEGEAQPGHD